LYRVRCKDWAAVHGENLTWDEAGRLKDHVASKGFRTARVEDMAVDPPSWYAAPAPAPESTSAAPNSGADPVTDMAVDPELEALRAPAFAAAAGAAAAANQRVAANSAQARAAQLAQMTGTRPVVVPLPVVAAGTPPPPPKPSKFAAPPQRLPKPRPANAPPRVVPRDKTVKDDVVRRTEPPPRDRTVSGEVLKRASAPPAEPPRPLISPLGAAMMADDALDVPDGQVVGDDDLSDLVGDLGGSPTDKDVEQAKAQADAERRNRG
jgi:hypothetical protein